MHRLHIFNSRSFINAELIKKTLILALCAAPLAYSQHPAPTVSHDDSAFVKDAAEGGMDEVRLGQLAQQKSANDRVKMFGKRMMDDHGKLGSELQTLAARKNVTLPSDISLTQKASYELLSTKSGSEFDKSYIEMMVKDHQDDIAAFQKEVNTGTDGDVKTFSSRALPMLQEHLRMARDLAHALGVSVK